MKTHLIILVFVHCLLLLPTVIYSQGVAINTVGTEADPSAMLDVSSTEKGVLVTRITTVQRDAISSPAQGLIIYNTTTKCIEFYENSSWYSLGCTCTLPDIPVAIAGTGATATQVTANWNSATGATSYNLDVSTVSDFSSFVAGYENFNVGAVTTYDVTGLICNTTYYYRIRAVNSCGTTGSSNIISYSTTSCPYTQMCLAIGSTGAELARVIVQTSDGGYVLVGRTNNYGAGVEDLYIVKLDGVGAIQWTRTVGTANMEDGLSIIQTSDGGYAVAGMTQGTSWDGYVVKLNSSGTVQWTKIIGGAGAVTDMFYSIVQTSDGGYALAGYTSGVAAGDLYVVKLDGSGNLLWTRTVGGATGTENAYNIVQSSDGGLAVAGYTDGYGAGNIDFYIVKLDGSGTVQWTRTVGGAANELAQSIIQTSDGGFVISGRTASYGAGGNDLYVVKVDGSGNLLWTRTVGGANDEESYSISQTVDGGLIVAGNTNSFGAGNNDFYLVKLDGSGALLWTRTVGGTGEDFAKSVIQTSDDGYVVAGYSNSIGYGGFDMYVVKLDNNSPPNTCCTMNSGGTSGSGGASGNGGVSGTYGASGSGGSSGSGGLVMLNCGN